MARRALVRRAFSDARIRTIAFAYLFAIAAYVNASAYRSTAWRAGGVLAIFAAVYGVLGAVRASRAEEDAGPPSWCCRRRWGGEPRSALD